MYRKLRLKFIGISTLSTVVVLFIVLGSVNLITYSNIVSDIFTRLDFISKNSDDVPQTEDIEKMQNKNITPETQYETRYITVMVDKSGNVIDFNDEHIAAIEGSEINDFIKYATSREVMRGIFVYDSLYYAFLKTDAGDLTRLTIMDCTRNISTNKDEKKKEKSNQPLVHNTQVYITTRSSKKRKTTGYHKYK